MADIIRSITVGLNGLGDWIAHAHGAGWVRYAEGGTRLEAVGRLVDDILSDPKLVLSQSVQIDSNHQG